MISAIVAMTQENVIGKNNKLLWHLPEDFKWFKWNTMGKKVIMGRKTYESIGKPLPNRENIVISKKNNIKNVKVVSSIEEALSKINSNEEAFIIGGGSIYKETLPFIDRLYITTILSNMNGDTHFPLNYKNDYNWIENREIIQNYYNEHNYLKEEIIKQEQLKFKFTVLDKIN